MEITYTNFHVVGIKKPKQSLTKRTKPSTPKPKPPRPPTSKSVASTTVKSEPDKSSSDEPTESSEDDSSNYESDEEDMLEEVIPLPETRPGSDDPVGRIHYDTIEALWAPPSRNAYVTEIQNGIKKFYELLKPLRDLWKSTVVDLHAAEAAKNLVKSQKLREKVQSYRQTFEKASMTAITFGHAEIVRRYFSFILFFNAHRVVSSLNPARFPMTSTLKEFPCMFLIHIHTELYPLKDKGSSWLMTND